MAIKFEKIEPGMTLLDIHREKMGTWGASRLARLRRVCLSS